LGLLVGKFKIQVVSLPWHFGFAWTPLPKDKDTDLQAFYYLFSEVTQTLFDSTSLFTYSQLTTICKLTTSWLKAKEGYSEVTMAPPS